MLQFGGKLIKLVTYFNYFYLENNESEVDSKIILSEINLKIKTNELVVIIGEVGSGKSTFLASILHETPAKEGSIKWRGRIAYVEQEPFIQ